MAQPLVIFEDTRVSRLEPLTLTRPVFDLLCGAMPLGRKLVRRLGTIGGKGGETWTTGPDGMPDFRLHMRDYLADLYDRAVDSYRGLRGDADLVTLVNGRLVPSDDIGGWLDPAWPGAYTSKGVVAAANLPSAALKGMDRYLGEPLGPEVFADLPSREIDVTLIEHPWDLVNLNGREIERDFGLLGGAETLSELPSGVFASGTDMRIGKDVTLSPGVVIDASEGPVVVADGVNVMANASLRGPLYVGPGSVVKMGARIYGETTLGPVCKVGGEVAETIVQGYSNKQHDGFLGHSYLGEWINIGAGTDTSDMKNNYSTVRVPIGGESVDSGHMFAGLFMGDHSKSGIGMTFNTGTSVGVCCSIFGSDYPPKYIPSFIWGGSSRFAEHEPWKAIETAKRAMDRRNTRLDSLRESVLKKVFDLTAGQREAFLR
jgi:UDP-N-acetylglucosamine diphosphorylase/glucosamine-1-phosphate N-acetyltransferase